MSFNPSAVALTSSSRPRHRATDGLIAILGTIRGRILIAFLIMSLITGALGGYAAFGISRAGDLAGKTFDQSLMSINYARAAAADFSAMQAAFAGGSPLIPNLDASSIKKPKRCSVHWPRI